MKHIVLFPTYILLTILSFLIGGLCYLWGFDKYHWYAGASLLERKLRFSHWYPF